MLLEHTPPLPASVWCSGEVVTVEHPHPDAVVLRVRVRDQPGHRPGQHYLIKLTADDGYSNLGDPWREQRYWGD